MSRWAANCRLNQLRSNARLAARQAFPRAFSSLLLFTSYDHTADVAALSDKRRSRVNHAAPPTGSRERFLARTSGGFGVSK